MTRDRSKDPPKTAAELMAELQNDPAFRARQEAKEAARRSGQAAYASAAEGVLRELRTVGFDVQSVGELRKRRSYKKAVPVLARWLPRLADKAVKEDVIRTLSVPWARDAVPVLLKEYRDALEGDPAGTGLRWAVANGLEVLATDEVFDDVVELLHLGPGASRQMLVLALAKMTRPEAVEVLVNLLDDEEVSGHVVSALAKLGAAVPREKVEPFLKHKADWVRKDARKLLR